MTNVVTFYEVEAVAKCANVLRILEQNGYTGGEITSKEFNKMFKGKNICSLNWLRENGLKNGRVIGVYCYKGEEGFAKIARVETFEMKLKEPTRTHYLTSNGKRIDDVDAYEYVTRRSVRELVNKMYPNVEVATETTDTINAKRYFYVIDLDTLRKIVKDGYAMHKAYYTQKLKRAQREVDKLTSILATI